MIALAMALAATWQSAPPSLLDAAQTRGLDDLLYVGGFRRSDLHAGEPLTSGLPMAVRFHEDPLKEAGVWKERLGQNSSPWRNSTLSLLRTDVFGEPSLPSGSRSGVDGEIPEAIPLAVHQWARRLVRIVHEANEEVRQAIGALSPDEKRDLIESLPRYAVHPRLLTLDFAKRPMPSWEWIRTQVAKVDLRRIRFAAERMQSQVQTELPFGVALARSISFTGKFKFNTAGITCVLAGTGNDEHEDRDAQLTIDLGGNDRYSGRHGAGIGYASIHIDLQGDDVYDVPDLSLGAGVLGMGMAWDLAGNDVVRTRSLALGAGLAGVGVFRSGRLAPEPDGAESVLYRSAAMSQGFGFFGIGIFSGSKRFEEYHGDYLVQGAGLTEGIGVFCPGEGTRAIEAEGLAPGPLVDGQKRSRSQGFGGRVGFHPAEIGGIGVARIEAVGTIRLRSGSESQGCGLDGGLGLLWTSSPAVRIESFGRAQGFGSNQGVGVFMDRSAQTDRESGPLPWGGSAEESGIGILADLIGDDSYRGGPSSPGSSWSGGLGLFFDLGGNNRCAGFDGPASDGSGIGAFLDFGSLSRFVAVPQGSVLQAFGFGSLAGAGGSRAQIDDPGPEPLPLPNATWKLPSDALPAIREAAGLADYADRLSRRQALSNLRARAALAMRGLRDESNRRPLRAAEIRVAAQLAAESLEAREALNEALSSAIGAERSMAMAIVAEAGLAEYRSQIASALKQSPPSAEAIRAAGTLGGPEFAADLLVLCASVDPKLKRAAANALSRGGDVSALSTAQVLASDADPFVRESTVRLFGRLGPESMASLALLVQSPDETTCRSAIRAYGRMGSPEALNVIGSRLADSRAGVRIECLLALELRCPPEFRREFDRRRDDADLRVSRVAQSLDPGR